jgi:hypothetical protein
VTLFALLLDSASDIYSGWYNDCSTRRLLLRTSRRHLGVGMYPLPNGLWSDTLSTPLYQWESESNHKSYNCNWVSSPQNTQLQLWDFWVSSPHYWIMCWRIESMFEIHPNRSANG